VTFAKSQILRRIASHLAFSTVIGVVVAVGVWMIQNVSQLAPLRSVVPLASGPISHVPHMLTSGVLGLLLVFRTNAAYDRYCEARLCWSAAVSQARSCGRLVGSWAAGAGTPEAAQTADSVSRLLVAYNIALMQHVRGSKAREREGEGQGSSDPPSADHRPPSNNPPPTTPPNRTTRPSPIFSAPRSGRR